MAGADVMIAYAAPGPGTIHPEWVASMAPDPIVFACANPVPEIWPWEAHAAGAAQAATDVLLNEGCIPPFPED